MIPLQVSVGVIRPHPSCMDAPSATKLVEKELMRWAFGPNSMVPLLAPWLFGDRPHHGALEITQPVLAAAAGKTGELDAMIWPVGDPTAVTVLEAKRIRVDADTLLTEQIGGLQGIREGVAQVRAHIQLGFARVYLTLFVSVDSRKYSEGHWIGGGLPHSLSTQIVAAVQSATEGLDVGVLVFVLDQPVDEDVRLGGCFGLLHSRHAPVRSQPAELTARIRVFIDSASRPAV
jgi:hypothetical protein